MSQVDIYNFLSKNKGKWYNAIDLADILKINLSSINISLVKLVKSFKEVEKKIVKEIKPNKVKYYYRIKK